MRYLFAILAVVACLCSPSTAQTPADAPTSWDQTVAAVGGALVNDDPAPAAVMLAGIELQTFDPDDPARIAALLERTTGSTLLFWRVYNGVPRSLAADMAEDINAADVPEPLRRRFTPHGTAAMRDANAVAAEWIRDTLAPADGQPIAVIVAWRGNSGLPSLAADSYARQITFILLCGEKDENDQVKTSRIVFGNPLAGVSE